MQRQFRVMCTVKQENFEVLVNGNKANIELVAFLIKAH